MAFSETQLTTWANQGSITQSSETYATLKRSLEAANTGYANRDYNIFLQGSYGNSTNIYSESDVDVIIRLNSAFHYNIESLSLIEQTAFQLDLNGTASYSSSDFKRDVITALTNSFGNDVTPDTKAIKIKANASRRNADVIAAIEHRYYTSYPNAASAVFKSGICFYTSTGQPIVNFPRQHSYNCTQKHQNTYEWYKPLVRILKNMRGKLVADGVINKSIAPSYYIEGLLYNVPNDKFGTNYTNTFVNAINWIDSADRTKFVCANEHYYLVRDSQWPAPNCELFLKAIINLWNN